MKKIPSCLVLLLFTFTLCPAFAEMRLQSFNVRPFSANELDAFVQVFSEMRGPLRARILKDRKTSFEDADPLAYVKMLQGEKDVKKMLKKHDLTWEGFSELMGNVVLAYFSIQPQKTKVALVRQLADYGLELQSNDIPADYRPMIREIIQTDAGASLASMALEMVLTIPEQNVAIVQKRALTLDKMFYTRFWKDKLGGAETP